MEATELESIRKQLGLSQQNLADLLGIHRSAVSQMELGNRSLPYLASLKAAVLESIIESYSNASQPVGLQTVENNNENNQTDSFAKKLRIARNEHEKLLLQKEELAEKQEQILLRRFLLDELKDEDFPDEALKQWLEADTGVMIEKWGPEATEAIDYQIAFLEFQIGYYESKLPKPVEP
jgi:transcriptional regulator with XRE-family HTH domain